MKLEHIPGFTHQFPLFVTHPYYYQLMVYILRYEITFYILLSPPDFLYRDLTLRVVNLQIWEGALKFDLDKVIFKKCKHFFFQTFSCDSYKKLFLNFYSGAPQTILQVI